MKRFLVSVTLSAVIGGGALVAFTAPASAAIACNRAGDCWHTAENYRYRPSFGVTVHSDNWKFSGTRYHWNEHEGRGYWRNGIWIKF